MFDSSGLTSFSWLAINDNGNRHSMEAHKLRPIDFREHIDKGNILGFSGEAMRGEGKGYWLL